jgi:uncharacterized protein
MRRATKVKTARLNIVLAPEEKDLAEQLAAEYGRRTGTEMTLSSYVRYLLRQAALDTIDASDFKQQRLPLPSSSSPKRRRRPRPSEQLEIYREQIKAIAERHHVTNVRVFGSTARGEDTDKSDLDLLVTPIKGATGLMELVRIESEVKKLIKVPVDVVLDSEIPEQHREKINREAIAL